MTAVPVEALRRTAIRLVALVAAPLIALGLVAAPGVVPASGAATGPTISGTVTIPEASSAYVALELYRGGDGSFASPDSVVQSVIVRAAAGSAHYSFAISQPGRYYVRAEAPGWVALFSNGSATAPVIGDSLVVTDAPVTADIALSTPRITREVTGRVVDTVGAPVAGAQVAGGTLTTQTAADGGFTLTVAAGAATLRVAAAGFAATSFGVDVPDTPRWIGLDVADLVVQRLSGPTGEGATGVPTTVRVLDASGAPEAGAGVGLSRWDGTVWTSSRLNTTDSDGVADLSGLAAGTYALDVRPGLASLSEPLPRSTTLDGPGTFTIAADETTPRRVDLSLARGRVASGRLVDVTGQPIVGATVEARQWVPGPTRSIRFAQTTTDADGRYVVHLVSSFHPGAPESVTFRYSALGFQARWFGGASTPAAFTIPTSTNQVPVPPSGDVVVPEQTLPRTTPYTGSVVDQHGRAVPGARVRVDDGIGSPLLESPVQQLVAGDDGRFATTGDYGTRRVVATAPACTTATSPLQVVDERGIVDLVLRLACDRPRP